jgi:hypothetical protein
VARPAAPPPWLTARPPCARPPRLQVGPLINFNNAIMCGVPGGIDYVMLFFVKEGWMEPIQEKRYNSVLNIWMRAPLLVSTGTLVFVQGFVQTQHVPAYVRATRYFLMFLACWCAHARAAPRRAAPR